MSNGPFDFFDKHEYELGFCEWYRDPVACLLSYFLPWYAARAAASSPPLAWPSVTRPASSRTRAST